MTIDEIAEAVDVGHMTVFNHFPRKEDMVFDREQKSHDLAFEAIFSDRPRFAGQTIEIASDTVIGERLTAAFSEAAGRSIA